MYTQKPIETQFNCLNYLYKNPILVYQERDPSPPSVTVRFHFISFVQNVNKL